MPEDQQAVFAAVADETRRELLCLLARQPLPVHALAEHFDISRPAISRHLKLLAGAGLVRRCAQGRENVYELDPLPLQTVRDWTDALAGYWAERLGNLKRLAEED